MLLLFTAVPKGGADWSNRTGSDPGRVVLAPAGVVLAPARTCPRTCPAKKFHTLIAADSGDTPVFRAT